MKPICEQSKVKDQDQIPVQITYWWTNSGQRLIGEKTKVGGQFVNKVR